MNITASMKAQAENVNGSWAEVPGAEGYLAMSGYGGFSDVAYLALPAKHPLIGQGYDDLADGGPEVNGGLTYADDNVFGWDYGHGFNSPGDDGGTVETDTAAAVRYFQAQA